MPVFRDAVFSFRGVAPLRVVSSVKGCFSLQVNVDYLNVDTFASV